MKNFSILSIAFLILSIVASCGPKPEEQVKEFAVKFGDFVNTNQKDSVQKYYPEFELTDSLASVPVSNITVTPGNIEGVYLADFSSETFITVKLEKDGKITILESKGILVFPSNWKEILEKDSKWDDTLNDFQRRSLVNELIQKEKEKELSSRLSILDFCSWNSSEKIMEMKSDKKVISRLEKLGYTCEKKWSEYEEYCGWEPIKVDLYEFKRDLYGYNMYVKIEPLSITIEFPNEELLDNFIQTVLANRYKRAPNSNQEDITFMGPNEDCYWDGTDVFVSGKTVTISSRFEC